MAEERVQRGLATILAAGVVGHNRMIRTAWRVRWRSSIRYGSNCSTPRWRNLGGIAKTTGDGIAPRTAGGYHQERAYSTGLGGDRIK